MSSVSSREFLGWGNVSQLIHITRFTPLDRLYHLTGRAIHNSFHADKQSTGKAACLTNSLEYKNDVFACNDTVVALQNYTGFLRENLKSHLQKNSRMLLNFRL